MSSMHSITYNLFYSRLVDTCLNKHVIEVGLAANVYSPIGAVEELRWVTIQDLAVACVR